MKYENVLEVFLTIFESERLNKTEELQKDGLSILGNVLFQGKNPPVKFISKNALEVLEMRKAKGLPWKAPCYEHFYGRKDSVYDIWEAWKRGKSNKFLTKLIESRCRGHYTTPEENMELRRWNHLKSWRDMYASAGIELLPWDPTPNRTYDYIIEGETYESISKVSEKYGVTKDGVTYRCKSDSERFKDWIRKPIDE